MRKLIFLCLTVALVAPSAFAETNLCAYPQELDRYRLLKRISMDLRLHGPTYEEYTALDAETELPESTIDSYLESDDFRVAARRFHEDLLWPQVGNVAIADLSVVIVKSKKNDIYSVLGAPRRKAWRKGTGNETCGNWKQGEFNDDGSPIPNPIKDENGKLLYLEDGYVEVEPYWSPGYPIKICAFDAQTALYGVKVPCTELRAKSDPKCGCGENLRWCFGGGSSPYSQEGVVQQILSSAREQLLMVVDDHTIGNAAYSEILTTKRTYWNGALAHWKEHLAGMTGLNKTYNALDANEAPLPENKLFTDPTWEAADRLEPHAGIVTLPAYTLRFQTNRGRANRFRIAFTGQYFVPPSNPTDTNCDPLAEDLTQKCTCRSCHQVLEPLAAHFGLIAEAGSTFITDKTEFPVYNEKCDPNVVAKTAFACNRFYVTSKDSYNPGTLFPYQFADIQDPLHQSIATNLDGGPILWAQSIIANGQFHSAIIRHLFRHLMGRGLILDPTRDDNELDLLSDMTAEFKANDNFKGLVKSMVQLPQYRRVR